jgi:hypothetical protein
VIPLFSVVIEYNKNLEKALTKARRDVTKAQARLVMNAARRLMQKGAKSRPGEVPGSRTGNYKRSIRYKLSEGGTLAFVGPTWPKGAHANLLKYGTVKMKPRRVPAEKALEDVRPRLAAMYSGKL